MKWPLVGHDWAVRQMQVAVAQEEMPHALLITGPASVGKLTLATLVAKAMLCRGDADARPCGTCSACKRLDSGNYPDFMIIEPEDPAKPRIKVDQIRDLERFLYLTPNESRYKIAIIVSFDGATVGAANALLKTLEEPPPYAYMILLANDAETLLPTIVSRSQQLALRPLNRQRIQQGLITQWGIEETQAERIARLSGGRMGWAALAVKEPETVEHMLKALEQLFDLLQSDLPERFQKAKTLARDEETLMVLLEYWQVIWRDILLLQTGNEKGIIYAEKQAAIAEASRAFALETSLETLKALKSAQTALIHNANTQLTVENLFLNLPLFSKRV